MIPHPSAFIIGINGFIGGELRAFLRQKGWHVDGSSSRAQPDLVEFDFRRPIAFAPRTTYDLVIYCSYVFNFDGEDPNLPALALLRETVFADAIAHVFISSLSAVAPGSHYASSKLAAEKIFENDFIIRPGFVLGAGGLYLEMVKQVRSSQFFPLFDGGRDLVAILNVSDLCQGLFNLLSAKHPCGTFHLMNAHVPRLKEILSAIRGDRNRPRFISLPAFPFIVMFTLLRVLGSRRAGHFEDRLHGLKRNHDTAKSYQKLPNLIASTAEPRYSVAANTS